MNMSATSGTESGPGASIKSARRPSERFARRVLTANALFSLATGGLCLLAAPWLTAWLGLSGATTVTVLRVLGLGVVLFGLFVAWSARQRPISPPILLTIVLADFSWVLLSIVLLLGGWIPFSTGGKWIVALTADVVLLLGILEFFGWRRLQVGK